MENFRKKVIHTKCIKKALIMVFGTKKYIRINQNYTVSVFVLLVLFNMASIAILPRPNHVLHIIRSYSLLSEVVLMGVDCIELNCLVVTQILFIKYA